MNVLIIGLGSIAKKHIIALKAIRKDVHFFALRSKSNADELEDVKNISNISECPFVDFVIISNPTALHAAAIEQVIQLNAPLFIEKPPFHSLEGTESILSLIKKHNLPTYTAFNLRFLDSLTQLKKTIDIKKVQEVNVYCGSYLPSWRSNVDYKKSYSANAAMGGGVHLDLIHELDYVLWIFGLPSEFKTTLRSNSNLEIDAIDYANYVLTYPHFVVNIVLNYYRRDPKRTCEIVFDDATWNVDLLKNDITNLTDNSKIFQSQQTVQETYKNQMDYFCDCLASNKPLSNSLTESINTLKIALS